MVSPIRIELPTGLQVGTVNAYLFRKPEPVLVDTGLKSAESWEALQLGLAKHGLTVEDLSRVVITHAHVDHFGQAAAIAAQSDADVWVCDLGEPWLLETKGMWHRRLSYYRDSFLKAVGLPREMGEMIVAGMEAVAAQSEPVPAERVRTFRKDGQLQMGGRAWQVLYTPGHASMQTCFYQPQSQELLSADMLLAIAPTPVVETPLNGTGERIPGLPQFMQSLDLIEALEVDVVYPGHGRQFGEHRRVIRRQRQRILARKAECLEWIDAGFHTPVALLDKMYAHRPAQLRFAGLWMLIGYLDLLVADDVVECQSESGVWHYYRRSNRKEK